MLVPFCPDVAVTRAANDCGPLEIGIAPTPAPPGPVVATNRSGVRATLPLRYSDAEMEALQRSAAILRSAAGRLG